MHKLFVMLSLWCFSVVLSSEAYAAKSRDITLPHYNPERYRVPATPEAQALHKKIMKVSKDLATLKAVPLDDGSIDQRLAQMIKAKIKGISLKLDVLKKDMTRRQEKEKTRLQKQGSISRHLKTQVKLKRSDDQNKPVSAHEKKISNSQAVKISKGDDQGDSTSEEIKALKISLQGIIQKLEILEKRTKRKKQGLPLQKKMAETQKTQATQRQMFNKAATIPLPVAKQIALLAPTMVRTTIIYPAESLEKISFNHVKSAKRGIVLPIAKPFPLAFKNRRNKTQFWQDQKQKPKKYKKYKRYASVEDQLGQKGSWSEIEVLKATNRCLKLFRNLNIDYVEKAPIKNGRCGTAAPIRFKGFGTRHSVSISPPATLNCKAVAVIANWMNKKVQPLAIKLLGSPIAKIHNISSYNCRNRYGRKNGRISEHAYANALDIMAFTTQRGERVDLLKHFYGDDEKGQFLRTVHKLACKDKFGTVLGPNANAAHKNHFHLDLAKRRRSAYCE